MALIEIFDKISDELKNKCWDNVTPESLTEFIEELIVNNCELKIPSRKHPMENHSEVMLKFPEQLDYGSVEKS